MSRSILKKVAWVERTASMVFGLALVLALLFGVATMAFAANGNNFILGSLKNAATQITRLTGNVSGGPALQVINPSTGTGSTALSLNVASGKTPMKVNSSTKVTNLNADQLDGLHSTQFVQGGGTAIQGKEAIPAGETRTILTTSNPSIQVQYECPSTTSNSGYIKLSSPGSEDLNVFVDDSSFGSGGDHYVIGPNGYTGVGLTSNSSGSHATIQAQGTNVATIEMFSYHRATDCHTQAQALVTR